jgi:diguanylate cyclase (GGDEF)-like protein/PAS domain S-box-containing protein
MNPLITPKVEHAPLGRQPTDAEVLIDLDEHLRLQHAAELDVAQLRATLDSLLDPHIVISTLRNGDGEAVDFRFIDVNRAAADYLSRTREDLVGRAVSECYPAEIARGLIDHYLPAADEPGPLVLNDRPITSAIAGTERYLDVRATRHDDLITITWRDVTERHEATEALSRSEHLMRTVLDSSPDPILQIGPDLRIEYVNRAAAEAAAVTMDAWIGRTWRELGFPDHLVERYERRTRRVFETGETLEDELDLERADYGRAYETRYVPLLDADGQVAHVVSISRDVTKRHIAEQLLLERATRDPLTGLANRAALLDEIDRSVQVARRSHTDTAVLMVDLDNFKHVNDSLGHAVGDILLVTAAERIRSVVRGGEMIARFGGDEFVVVMRDLDDPTRAVDNARRIVEAFRRPIDIDGADVYTTASVGVALAAPDSTPDDLLREADTALYVSKGEGRDRVAIFNEELRAAVTARLRIEAQLRPALDRGELEVWYQPEVALPTGRVTAVEALLRWRRPGIGIVPAQDFIDIAEDTGLVVEFGPWVLRTACADAARWSREHPSDPITVRVNLSARQVVETGLLGEIDRALEESGLPTSLLCLEITESTLLHHSAVVLEHLQEIRHRGIRIALDDFGTGYASLAYLREFPVDVLKIDRSFVSNITDSNFDARLVGGIVALADALDVAITAEGVETPEQADRLVELGCERAQGFLFSPAVTADAIDAMLA